MEAHTYPDPRVSRFVNEYMVPVQFNVVDDPGARRRYHAYWTPTAMLRDDEDAEYRRSVGSVNPEQFLAEFALGRGLRFFHSGQFERAVEELERAQQHTIKWPSRHAENLYMLGVARYKATDEWENTNQAWEELEATYPDSSWTCKTKQLKME